MIILKIFYSLIFILYQVIYIKSEEENIKIDLPFPVSFTLSNNNILIFSSKGFYTYDLDFSLITNHTFYKELSIQISNNNNFPAFAQFTEGQEFVLCLILGNLYLFTNEGFYINSTYIGNDLKNESDSKNNRYMILPNKIEDSNYYFFIIYTYFSQWKGEIFFLNYKIDEKGNNELIDKKTYKDNEEGIIRNGLVCQIVKKKNEDDYIICFYEVSSFRICKISFHSENNFTTSNKICLDGSNFIYSNSIINEDYSKIYLCYASGEDNGCFYYDINEDKFSSIYNFGGYCRADYYVNYFIYFKYTKDYIFSCASTGSEYYLIKFKENITNINPNNTGNLKIGSCSGLNSFSIIYLPNYGNYALLSDGQCDGSRTTLMYKVSNFFVEIQDDIDEKTEKKTQYSESKDVTTEKSNEIIQTNKVSDIIEISTSIDKINDKCNDEKKLLVNNNCVCNIDKGYYPILYENNLFNDECYDDNTKPENFFFNKKNNYFEICFKNCKKCNNHGNKNENNCTLCAENYIFSPDIINSTNCVPKCNFYYYYSYFGIYSCTENFQCPREANLFIRKKNKCINNCYNDDKYKLQYNGECIEKCPEETKVEGNKCKVTNINTCSLSLYEFVLSYKDIESNNIESITKNYAEEFNYTNNQIVKFKNDEYSLVIYKNSTCIKELSLMVPEIDFGKCYEKVKKVYNITQDLIVALLEKKVEIGSASTSYGLFNPINGEKLNTSKICQEETIIMKENVLTISGVNSSLISFFAQQGINVFNLSDKFYSDSCLYFLSPNEKDIPLRLRVKIFFPNVSLCDAGCISKGVNITSMESICHCPFTEFTINYIISNTLKYTEILNEVYSFISESNIDVLLCFKDIFDYKFFKRCTGGFIIMSLIFFQTICVLFYKFKSNLEIKKYIFVLSKDYIASFKTKNVGFKTNINIKNKNLLIIKSKKIQKIRLL